MTVEGARATLQGVVGFRRGLLTNFTDSEFVRQCLAEQGLLDMLDCVVVSADVDLRKLHTEIFTRLAKLCGVKAGETLFVGDDVVNDVAGAKATGMQTVLVVGENYIREGTHVVEPDFVISSISELGLVVNKILESGLRDD